MARLTYRKITVDIDGVVAVVPIDKVVALVNQLYGTDYRADQLNSFGWLEKTLARDFGLSEEEAFGAVWNNEDIYRQARVALGARKALEDLTRLGAQMDFVTGRASFLRDCTFAWFVNNLPFVKQNRIWIRENENLSRSEFKIKKILELQPQVHLEDSFEITQQLNQYGIQTVLFRQLWNQEAPQELRKDWLDAYQFLVRGSFPA